MVEHYNPDDFHKNLTVYHAPEEEESFMLDSSCTHRFYGVYNGILLDKDGYFAGYYGNGLQLYLDMKQLDIRDILPKRKRKNKK